MKLNEICNRVAANVLGELGTIVQYMGGGRVVKPPDDLFDVLGHYGGKIQLKGGYGYLTATMFRKYVIES